MSAIEKIKGRPWVTTIAILLPVVVGAYIQLQLAQLDIETKQAKLTNKSEATEAETDEVESKAGKLERETVRTNNAQNVAIEQLRDDVAARLELAFDDIGRVAEVVDLLEQRTKRLEEKTLTDDERLRSVMAMLELVPASKKKREKGKPPPARSNKEIKIAPIAVEQQALIFDFKE